MGALFLNFWILLLVAFVIGAAVAWLVLKLALPHVDDLQAQTGQEPQRSL